MSEIVHAFANNITAEKTGVIYFAGSISVGRDDVPTYAKLINKLQKYGKVLTDLVGGYRLSVGGQSFLSDGFIHDRDLY